MGEDGPGARGRACVCRQVAQMPVPGRRVHAHDVGSSHQAGASLCAAGFADFHTKAWGLQVAHASSPPDSGESSDENEDAEAQAARRAAAEALTTPADIPPAITTIRIAQPDPVAAIPKRHPIDPPRTAAANAVAHARQTKRKQLLPEQTYADGNVSEPGQLEFTAVPAAASEPAATAFSKLPPAPSQRKRQKVATPHNPPDASVQDAKAAKEAEQAKAEAGTTKRRQRANEGRDAAIEQLAVSHSNGDAEEAGDQDVGLQAVKGEHTSHVSVMEEHVQSLQAKVWRCRL